MMRQYKGASKKWRLFLAAFISYSLSPAIVLPILLVLMAMRFAQNEAQFWQVVLILLGAGVMPFNLLFLWFKKTARISDWDIRNRSEREGITVNAFIIGVVMLVIVWSLIDNPILTQFFALVIVWFGLFTLITHYWKISAHSATITLVVLLLPYLLAYKSGWFAVLIPAMWWARVVRKNHTLAQVLGGSLLSGLVVGVANILLIYV